MADALAQVEGAFSIVMMTRNRIFAARDPHGFRPLCMGRIAGKDGAPDTFVFASETCAFDLLHAKYERDVEPGELVMVSEDGVTSRIFAGRRRRAASSSMCTLRGRTRRSWALGAAAREEMGRQLARESGVAADLVVPVPDSGVTAAIGYAAESGIPFNFGLIRNHYVGRTFIEPEQRVRDFGVRMKLNPVRSAARGQARDSDRRLDHSRDDFAEDRAHGAGGGSDRGASAHLVSADDFALFLWGGYAERRRT
jgi:amidophosphoribosyltransferase